VIADVAGSTRLYEIAGDQAAKVLIVDLQSELAAITSTAGGFVQGIVGDEVLALFEDVAIAVSSTIAMQEATDLFSTRRGTGMSVRIGLHYGPTIVEQGRVFGDTVNTAARMAAIAQGGQIIASEDVVKRFTDPFKDLARRFDRVKVKGKQEPIVVYDLLWQPALVTEILPTAATPTRLLHASHYPMGVRIDNLIPVGARSLSGGRPATIWSSCPGLFPGSMPPSNSAATGWCCSIPAPTEPTWKLRMAKRSSCAVKRFRCGGGGASPTRPP